MSQGRIGSLETKENSMIGIKVLEVILTVLFLSREEVLVHIFAHELRHLWQKNHPGKRGKVWGAKGQYSERDADAYAIRKMREWRQMHAVDIYREQPDIIPYIGGGIYNKNGDLGLAGGPSHGICRDNDPSRLEVVIRV
jgi:hypothetical protein